MHRGGAQEFRHIHVSGVRVRALMVGLIVGGLIMAVAVIGSWIEDRFEHLQSDLPE